MQAEGNAPVLILSGPPGVGKTTVARLLAERPARAVHLESDAFFRFIRSGYVEPWKPESHRQNQAVMRVVGQAAASYATAGYTTTVEGIVIPGWFFEPLRETLAEAGHRVAYAVLRASLEVCTARARDRPQQPLASTAAVKRLWESFADLGALEPHAIDVSDASPVEVAETLSRRQAEGLLDV